MNNVFFSRERGVPALLETSDFLRSKNPEPKSMITYLHTIYKVLVADKAEREKAEKGESGKGGENKESDKKDQNDDTK